MFQLYIVQGIFYLDLFESDKKLHYPYHTTIYQKYLTIQHLNTKETNN